MSDRISVVTSSTTIWVISTRPVGSSRSRNHSGRECSVCLRNYLLLMSPEYTNLGLEARAGFEPGIEVLQGHPRFVLFRSKRCVIRGNHTGQPDTRTPVHAQRGWRWLKLEAAGSSRARSGHSSAPPRKKCRNRSMPSGSAVICRTSGPDVDSTCWCRHYQRAWHRLAHLRIRDSSARRVRRPLPRGARLVHQGPPWVLAPAHQTGGGPPPARLWWKKEAPNAGRKEAV